MVPTSAVNTVTQRHVPPPISCFLLLALSLGACPNWTAIENTAELLHLVSDSEAEQRDNLLVCALEHLCHVSFVFCCQISDLDSAEATSPAMTQKD